jgi:glycosyltransferase involved in cell wall biosynthesis
VTAANGDAVGLPLVVLEAQAAGVPVVTSACGAAEEGVVDGVTGIACAEGAMEDLVRGISGFLTDDRAAEAASVAAVDFIRNRFDIRACSQRLEEQYDERRGDAAPVRS